MSFECKSGMNHITCRWHIYARNHELQDQWCTLCLCHYLGVEEEELSHWERHRLPLCSKPRLLNLILLNLNSKVAHVLKNLWNATFGLWKIRIMNGFFEWKQANITKTGNLSQLCDFTMSVSVDNYSFPSINTLEILWRSYCEKISMTEFIIKLQ